MSDHSIRSLLLRLGIGDFNATMIVPTMFYGPAQTDPDLTQSKLLVKAMQQAMIEMGATWIRPIGRLDQNTASCLHVLCGPSWNDKPWFELVTALLDAKDAGKSFKQPPSATGVELSGLPDVSAIPGGYLTLALGAFLGWRYLKKGR